MSPTLRSSRAIRARLAKRRGPRIARTVTIDRHGIQIEGIRLPFLIGTEIEVDHLIPGSLAVVNVGIYADAVEVRGHLPRQAIITHRFH